MTTPHQPPVWWWSRCEPSLIHPSGGFQFGPKRRLASCRRLNLSARGGARPQTRRLNPAGLSFACRVRVKEFIAAILLGRGGCNRREKSGGPPPLEPSFK